jgi:SNF2 family DNA or RNA helicase
VRIISIVPVPVIDCTIRQQIFSDDEYTVLDLRFRYGSRERRAAEDGELLPISAEEARTLAASEASGEPDEPVGSWFIAPSDELEQVLLRRLHTLLQESGCPPQPFTRGLAEYQSDEPARFLIGTDVYQLLALAGDELLQQGFELRMHGEAVSRAPGRSAVRITESGEDWLKVEEGLELEEGFLPIEDVPARGLVRAGDRTYVLPPGSRTGELLSALGQRRLGRRNLPALEEIAEYVSNPEHPALEEFFSLRRRLASFSRLEETEVPDSFRGSLRPYQRSGLAWLWFLHSYELGGCLADDMGLGKTIQALALLAKAREEGQMRRALVVCPVSTLGNWHREIGQFTPCLSAHIHSGQKRSTDPEALSGWDILLVGYATVHRDVELLRQLEFDYLILDEAQAIKNPGAKRRRAIASLHAVHRLALTGTPIENSTVELWSLMDILMPGILGSRTDFSRIYGKEIEEGEGIRAECAGAVPDEPLPADEDGRSGSSALARLRRIIRPLILRRTKAAVTPELPPREELVLHAEAGPKQTRVYESLRQRFADEVEEHISRGGRGEGGMKILEAMLRLRQAAILPSLVDSEFSQIPSAKIEMLYDRLLELREEGNRALVFSQFTSVLDEVQQRMAGCGLALFRLDGSTPQQRRDEAIAAFQKASGPGVFLISLKAGGVGINLTAADYVFLLDPWWNPAVESQAIDRAHRIGRKGGVLAYRLITKGTIEEKMLRLQERKRRISESLIRGESGALRELTDEDIRELFEKE